jgi:hypothetical protein
MGEAVSRKPRVIASQNTKPPRHPNVRMREVSRPRRPFTQRAIKRTEPKNRHKAPAFHSVITEAMTRKLSLPNVLVGATRTSPTATAIS